MNVDSLTNINYSFSAIYIQETWLEEGENTSQLELDGYALISHGKYCSQKGGLIIYLKNRAKSYKWKKENISQSQLILEIYIGQQEICWKIIGNL